MKKLSKLKLHELAAENLSNREMKNLKGGYTSTDGMCHCGCNYANYNGANSTDNCFANNTTRYSTNPFGGTTCQYIIRS